MFPLVSYFSLVNFRRRNHECRDVEDSYDGTGEGAVDGRSLMCADKFRIEKRRRRRSLTTVDVESATVLRRRQSPRNERPSVSSSRSANSVNEISAPALLPSFGQTSKEFHFARVGPDEQQQQQGEEEEVVVAPVTTKRRESAPDLNGAEPADSRPKIIIRLTSVDGLEFSLSSPVQDNLLQPTSSSSSFCPVRTVRVGAARPQNSSKSLLDCLVCFLSRVTMYATGNLMVDSQRGQCAFREPTTTFVMKLHPLATKNKYRM